MGFVYSFANEERKKKQYSPSDETKKYIAVRVNLTEGAHMLRVLSYRVALPREGLR